MKRSARSGTKSSYLLSSFNAITCNSSFWIMKQNMKLLSSLAVTHSQYISRSSGFPSYWTSASCSSLKLKKPEDSCLSFFESGSRKAVCTKAEKRTTAKKRKRAAAEPPPRPLRIGAVRAGFARANASGPQTKAGLSPVIEKLQGVSGALTLRVYRTRKYH